MADRLDDLARAVVRAWATAARAWLEAANAIGVGFLDIPAVESGRTGFNEEVVVIPAQQLSTDLHLEPFENVDGKKLPPDALAVVPPQVDAGEEAKVCVQVKPSGAIASGTYTGSLSDSPGGTALVDEIGVYVVGGPAP